MTIRFFSSSSISTGEKGSKFWDQVAVHIPEIEIQCLVIAGGGSGGGTQNLGSRYGGGGGAGGYREFTDFVLASGSAYTITIGAGGAAAAAGGTAGSSGSDSVFSTITSTGGGNGAPGGTNFQSVGNGGSGGGAGSNFNSSTGVNGGSSTAITPLATELYSVQGFRGGNHNSASLAEPGGGGGASAAGTDSNYNAIGGAGRASSITGSSVTRAGGGGAGFGAGGSGGGGNGVQNGNGGNGNANTGGGGGAASNSGENADRAGGNGGSGVVILKYPDTYTITIGAGLTGSTASPSGSLSYRWFNTSGSNPTTKENFDALFNVTPQGSGIDENIEINWLTVAGRPSYITPSTYFAWEVTGFLLIDEPGNYVFNTRSDDGNELQIDGQVLTSFYGGRGVPNPGDISSTINLSVGTYPFQYRMQQGTGGAGAQVRWQKPESSVYEVIPSSNFSSSGFKVTTITAGTGNVSWA